MASTNISKAYASSGTRTKWTWSFWLKRGTITNGDQVVSTCHLDNNNQDVVRFGASDDKLDWWSYQAGSYSNGGRLQTNRVFRDCNGWYHIVLRWDSSNSTAGDRMKMWINGVEETSFATDTNPTSGRESLFNFGNNSQTWKIGSGNNTQYFDGSLSHIHFCDNQLYQASDFGSFDSTTGEWKINTSPSVSYGTNGFFILKNGNSLTDESPNSNNWSSGNGTLTKTEDCPSNIFATYNPLCTFDSALAYTKGNTVVAYSGSGGDAWTTRWGISSIGMRAGKYYAEAKVAAIGTNQMYALGLAKDVGTSFTPSSSVGANGLAYYSTGNIFNGISGQDQTGLASYTTNDIIGLAIDATNGSAQWYKNGSAIGNAETIATDGTWFFVSNFYSSGKVAANFGNGYFEETAVSSAGTNASNIGIFEYDVPSGYTALCTKGLNE